MVLNKNVGHVLFCSVNASGDKQWACSCGMPLTGFYSTGTGRTEDDRTQELQYLTGAGREFAEKEFTKHLACVE